MGTEQVWLKDCKGRFKKGNIPWTKNKKGIHLSISTEFKKGMISKFKGVKRPELVGNTNGFKKGFIPWNKGIKMTVEQKNKLNIIGLEKGRYRIPLIKGKTKENCSSLAIQSEKMKLKWKTDDYVKKQMLSRKLSPNKKEMVLDKKLCELFPGQYKFVGCGDVIIGGKCPDWININGQKKIIELFGNYWHRGQNPDNRIEQFRRYGYKTLVIWESEMKSMGDMELKIANFHKE
jgi:hypothetical protein